MVIPAGKRQHEPFAIFFQSFRSSKQLTIFNASWKFRTDNIFPCELPFIICTVHFAIKALDCFDNTPLWQCVKPRLSGLGGERGRSLITELRKVTFPNYRTASLWPLWLGNPDTYSPRTQICTPLVCCSCKVMIWVVQKIPGTTGGDFWTS